MTFFRFIGKERMRKETVRLENSNSNRIRGRRRKEDEAMKDYPRIGLKFDVSFGRTYIYLERERKS